VQLEATLNCFGAQTKLCWKLVSFFARDALHGLSGTCSVTTIANHVWRASGGLNCMCHDVSIVAVAVSIAVVVLWLCCCFFENLFGTACFLLYPLKLRLLRRNARDERKGGRRLMPSAELPRLRRRPHSHSLQSACNRHKLSPDSLHPDCSSKDHRRLCL
jgi:hypothetical protein